ncbi:MAG: nucleoside-triphosphatase [Anaerolineae bacterium]|nr:nucleoside-triphosphatase [Anaerolineae bacterium]MDW8068002.1 nucleoside-triphosphatase [Anaerolineae bacterium]
MGQTLLLTGRPGVGKTTVIKAVVEALGPRAGGFYTEEIRGPGGRKGFRLITLDGEEAVMAHVEFRGPRYPRVSRYGVDVEAIAQVGVEALRRAMRSGRIIVVDEIGKMELFCGSFKETVLQAISGPYIVLATVMAHPHPWTDALKALPTLTLWEVTVENRTGMPERVRRWIEQVTRSAAGVTP